MDACLGRPRLARADHPLGHHSHPRRRGGHRQAESPDVMRLGVVRADMLAPRCSSQRSSPCCLRGGDSGRVHLHRAALEGRGVRRPSDCRQSRTEPPAIRRHRRRVRRARVTMGRVSHSVRRRHVVGAWLDASVARVLRIRRHWVVVGDEPDRHVGHRLAVSAASDRCLGLAGVRSVDRRPRRRSRLAWTFVSAAIGAEGSQGDAEVVVRARSLLFASAGHRQGYSQPGRWRFRLVDIVACCWQRKPARHIEGIRPCRNAQWLRISNTAYHPSQPRLAGIGLVVLLDIPACTSLVQTRGQRGAAPFHRITLYTVWRITARRLTLSAGVRLLRRVQRCVAGVSISKAARSGEYSSVRNLAPRLHV